MQDIEFTVQQGRLYMLQTRTGKRTMAAAMKIAVDMVEEGLITVEEALLRIDPKALDQLLHPTLDPAAHKHVVTKGLPASPGAACGAVFGSAFWGALACSSPSLLTGRRKKYVTASSFTVGAS
jgi:pyruvate,orthophosphate dikinase